MKRKILCFVLFLMIFPLVISAKTYSALDATVNLDETKWNVFTPDNIKDNPELEELGLTYEYMDNVFKTNNMYLDAALFDQDDQNNTMEFFVIAKKTTIKSNLHMYSDKDMKDIEKEIIKDTISTGHDIYSTNNYKYVYMYYTDQGLNLCDYYTVINGYVYTIKIQKVNAFTDSDKTMIKSIVDGISFKLDEKYEVAPKKVGFNFTRIIIYAIVGGVVGGLSALLSKKKKVK